jgi:hypothetical protein
MLIRMAQGVEYASHSIQWIDYKYNPMPHDTQATPLKQYGSQILKYEG